MKLDRFFPASMWKPCRDNGNCYVASEALFHLLGGKAAGWKPMWLPMNGANHWFLKHRSGLILDPTAAQFRRQRVPYAKARGCGFLTKTPSRRARLLMRTIVFTD